MTTLFTDDENAFCENAQISVSEMYYTNDRHVFQKNFFFFLSFFLMLVVHLYQQVVQCKVEELSFVLLTSTVVPDLCICITSSEQNRTEQNIV